MGEISTISSTTAATPGTRSHRSALEDHVCRAPRLGHHRLFNVSIGISAVRRPPRAACHRPAHDREA